MPGVPSGRGCDACRKQKKKCDIETYPCSRCRRLNIPCIGHGQQRYKFKNETVVLTVAKRVTTTSISFDQSPCIDPTPSKALSNGVSRLMSAFVNRISQDVDIRFQLPWNFGDYLIHLPRHLGISEALDAAVDALVTAHTSFCAGNLKPSREVLTKHAHCLCILRRDVSDVHKARTSETLAAIMVTSITQLFVFPSQAGGCTHTNGATRLLRSRGFAKPRDDFERLLMLTLRGPVVFEALLTDNIQLSSHDWKILIGGFPASIHDHVDGQWFACIAHVPDLIERSKAALIMHEPPSLNLLSLELEVRALLEDIRPIITKSRDRLDSFDATAVPAVLSNHLQAHYPRSLAMALGVGIILNCMLSGLEGASSTAVCEESVLWSEEIVQLAEICNIYRPLGSMAMLIALRMAWCGAACAAAKERIESMLVEYGACIGLTEESECGDLGAIQKRWTLQQF
ncbi:hypothetical protein XANCAGTX0491_006670 [Xanthoria calcicola]